MEVFRKMDSNSDGFLTINEILEGLDMYVKFPREIKEGFFSYLDTMRIGIVDYPRFLSVMKKTQDEKMIGELEDNWEWQNKIISKMKRWLQNQSKSQKLLKLLISTEKKKY